MSREKPLLGALAGAALPDPPDAVTVAERSLSRAELWESAAAVADRIAGAEVVAVHATPSLETVAAVVGCLLAGAAVVPVAPDAGPMERRHVLHDSRASLLLDPGNGTPADPPLPVVPVDLSQRSAASHPEPAPESVAMVLYTSGTTGPPKGVPVTRAAIAANVDALAEAWQWTPEDRLVHGLPLFHVHGLVLGILGALRIGCQLTHTGSPRPGAYAAARGTLYFGVPTVWSRVCADPVAARALAGARLLVSGSAPLPPPVFEDLAGLTGLRPVERYGMTETLITVSSRADGERRAGWVGVPLTGVQTRLAGEDGALLPADAEAVGELQVRGPTVFRGYLGRSDPTAFTVDGWFRTGDAAVVGQDGWHRIVGRTSTDLIKSGGYRIGAGEVENALLAHPGVREAAVVGVPDADLGQQVVAFVVADGVDPQQLIDFVAAYLSVHKRPQRVYKVDRLPRNAVGKVQKKLLVKLEQSPERGPIFN